MAFPDLFTTAQLEAAVGGADQLKQLLDKDGDGTADSTLITEVKAIANGEVYAVVQTSFDASDTTVQGAALLQQHAVTIGAYWAWQKGTGGQAIPEHVERGYEKARAFLDDVREKRVALGTSTEPTDALGPHQVDMDNSGKGWTRGNWGAFS